MPSWVPILPFFPFHIVRFEIMAHRRANCGKEALFADLLEDPEPFIRYRPPVRCFGPPPSLLAWWRRRRKAA
jgi:hypothetical protein